MRAIRGSIRMRYEVIVRDKNGKVSHRERRFCNSFVTNFVKWLRGWFTVALIGYPIPSYSANDTGNVGRTIPVTGTQLASNFGFFQANVNDDTHGICVGTSNQAVSPADYNLVGKIAHGTGAGQLVHGAQTYEAIEVVDNNSKWRNTRPFTNNSGSTITVKEIGIIFGMLDTGSATRYFLSCRDVLASPVDVPDGSTLTVRYTVQVTA